MTSTIPEVLQPPLETARAKPAYISTSVDTNQSKVLDDAQREPVEMLSRGTRRRAVVVSPEFLDRALEALEDAEDARAAAAARSEQGMVTHTELMNELRL